MFIKKHITKNQSLSDTKSLFVVNVPIGADFNSFKSLMSEIALGANIESFDSKQYYDPDGIINYDLDINLSKLSNPDYGKESKDTYIPVGCGVITFLDKSAMNLAYTSIKKLSIAIDDESKDLPKWQVLGEKATGNFRYSSSKNDRLDSKHLSAEVAISMREFEEKEHEVAEELSQMKEQVDEDGFTVVVGPHRKTKSGIMGSLKTLSDLEHDTRYSKKMQKTQKKDFYRFQIRERKKQEVNELLHKFKEDQQRVKEMRQKRRFNPY